MSLITNLINFNSAFSTLKTNILVTMCLWIFIEIIFFFFNPLNEESYRIQCNYDWILYNYCPDVVDVKINTKDDGGKVVYTYTNSIGQRVKDRSFLFSSKPQNVFIGDSFLQADEVNFDETFYGRLIALGHDVSALGYSSWNIIEYREAIEKLGYFDTHYHVFLMPNDITPAYKRSVYYERKTSPIRKIDTTMPSGFKTMLSKAYKNSLTKRLVSYMTPQNSNNLKPIEAKLFDLEHVEDCEPLSTLDDAYRNSLGYDYAVYSKNYSCWPELHKEAAKQALREIQLLVEKVSSLNSKLTIYMIPAGWSFSNQNTNGRKNNRHYFFGDESNVTAEPLTKYLASNLQGIEFVSLELLMSEWFDCIECENNFYFADDGHWTPETHRILADYLSKKLELAVKSSTDSLLPFKH